MGIVRLSIFGRTAGVEWKRPAAGAVNTSEASTLDVCAREASLAEQIELYGQRQQSLLLAYYDRRGWGAYVECLCGGSAGATKFRPTASLCSAMSAPLSVLTSLGHVSAVHVSAHKDRCLGEGCLFMFVCAEDYCAGLRGLVGLGHVGGSLHIRASTAGKACTPRQQATSQHRRA